MPLVWIPPSKDQAEDNALTFSTMGQANCGEQGLIPLPLIHYLILD